MGVQRDGGHYVFMWELLGAGMYDGLCVFVLLFTVALTIWPGFFLSIIFWGSSPAGSETPLFLHRFIILIIPLQLFHNIPLGAWRLVYNYISNDVQMLQNKCCSYLPNGGTKNNAQDPNQLPLVKRKVHYSGPNVSKLSWNDFFQIPNDLYPKNT